MLTVSQLNVILTNHYSNFKYRDDKRKPINYYQNKVDKILDVRRIQCNIAGPKIGENNNKVYINIQFITTDKLLCCFNILENSTYFEAL